MDLLKKVFLLFIIAFPLAQVARIQFVNGTAVLLNDVLLFSVIIIWAVLYFKKKIKVKETDLKIPILLFLSVSIISLLINIPNLTFEKFFISFLYFLRFASYALLYFIVLGFDKNFKKRVYNFLFATGLIVVALGFIQYFFYPSLRNLYYLGWDEHLYRMFSSFLDPNFAGAFFVLFFLYSLAFIEKSFNGKINLNFIFFLLSSVFALAAVYLTYSRSAILMLFMSVITYLILLGKKKLIFFAILLMTFFIVISPKSFQTEGTNLFRIISSEARISSFNQGLDIFLKAPVLGVGFNAYRYALNKYEGMDSKFWQTTHSGAGTDNSFIFVLATTGLVGLASYLYLLYKMFRFGKKEYKKNIYSVIFIASLTGLIINSLFINSLFYVLILEWVWILAGLTENN